MTGSVRATMLITLLLCLLVAAAANGAVLRGTVGGGALPSATAGDTVVRAVDVQSSVIRAATEVPRSGAWSLTVPAGPYTLLTSVVTRTGRRQAITPIVRVAPRSRVRVPVSLRRSSAPRARAKARQATVLPTGTAPIVAIKNLTATGPHADMGRGFSDMFITEFTDDTNPCRPTVVEWEKRDLIQRELDLGAQAAPGTRLRKRWLQPEVFVEGSVTTTAGGLSSWDVRLRDARTGDVVGGDHGSLPPGGDPFEAADQIGERLVNQLCGATYDVSVQFTTDNVQATFTARGGIGVTMVATGTGRTPRMPPTRFTGSASASYRDVVFTALLPKCVFGGPTSDSGSIDVTLEVTPAGHLRVTWAPSPLTLGAVAILSCEKGGSFPTNGPFVAGVSPTTFELPVTGGSQSITGDPATSVGGLGVFHSGLIIVTRRVAN